MARGGGKKFVYLHSLYGRALGRDEIFEDRHDGLPAVIACVDVLKIMRSWPVRFFLRLPAKRQERFSAT